MQWGPILSALMRNKGGVTLIVTQVAVTVAILCNVLFITEQRLSRTHRPSGTDESNIFAIANHWALSAGNLPSQVQADLAALRSLNGVVDAYVTNSYPLSVSGTTDELSLQPHQRHSTATAAVYYGDEHTLQTLGVELVAGRNFDSAQIADGGDGARPQPSGVIVTKALADKLYPGGNALGQPVFMETEAVTTRIIGIVAELQAPWVSDGGGLDTIFDSAILVPLRPAAQISYYIVRTRQGELASVMQTARRTLTNITRGRAIEKVQSLPDARADAYRNHRGFAVFLGVICAISLIVTALGIVGLTSFWVTQRRRQIGIRRALGASRGAIVQYFQTENLLIVATGVALGVGLANALNLAMVNSFEMARLPVTYSIASAVIALLLGQIATLWPALSAASISPAIAARAA
jgi:putative ABC transport system permease protein